MTTRPIPIKIETFAGVLSDGVCSERWRTHTKGPRLVGARCLFVLILAVACKPSHGRQHTNSIPSSPTSVISTAPTTSARSNEPEIVERKERAMGTSVDIIAYTNEAVDLERTHSAIDRAMAEIERLEAELSEWRDSSDIGRINQSGGTWVSVSPETLDVIEKALWVGRESHGSFDITFHSMGDLWKFGTAADAKPEPPAPDEVRRHRARIDYRRVEIDRQGSRVRIPHGRKIGLGGIAKGYIVDRAVGVLRAAGLRSFLVQAGGDLYAAGRKPDGTHWSAGIRDPRGPEGDSFATLELENHAFSTAGDYARAYVTGGKRFHHIIDPRTGYPATASRSVTIYAPDALTADMIDDAVFILGPEKGLALVNGLDGVGAVIVDAQNRVWVSSVLEAKVSIHKQPTDGI